MERNGTTKTSPKDITVKLARSAGYRRTTYISKSGKEHSKNVYKKEFDEELVAQWIYNYIDLFYKRLHAHPELKEFHLDIVSNTFLLTMKYIDIDALENDKVLFSYVNKVLDTEIKQAICKLGNLESSKKSKNIIKKNAFNLEAMLKSLDGECVRKTHYSDIGTSAIVIDLKLRLAKNQAGLFLLDSLINSAGKADLQNIDKFLCLSREQCTEELLQQLREAYSIICSALMSYTNFHGMEYADWKSLPTIKYSFEEK